MFRKVWIPEYLITILRIKIYLPIAIRGFKPIVFESVIGQNHEYQDIKQRGPPASRVC